MEKKKINLLAIQMESVIGNLEENITLTKNLILENLKKYENIDFLFLPEVWTVGWAPKHFHENSEEISNAKSIKMLKEIAKDFNINIIGGSIVEKYNNIYYNTCPVINRKGELVCTYNKNHLFSYYGDNEGNYITRGKNPIIVELESIKFGLTICYDIRFPEIYRAYRRNDADILVNMAAWPKSRKIHWDSLTTARAVENQSYFVALTQTGLLEDGAENLGHSMIISYDGSILDEIEENEGGVYAEISLEDMYSFRNKCTVLKDIKETYEVITK